MRALTNNEIKWGISYAALGWLENAVKKYKRTEDGILCNGESLLHFMCREGNAITCKTLVNMGYNTNAKDDYGHTPLYSAISSKNIECCTILISGGADVNHKDYNGNTPLIKAISTGDLDIVRVLIENGADVNLCNKYGESPLFIANVEGKIKIAKILINHSAESYFNIN